MFVAMMNKQRSRMFGSHSNNQEGREAFTALKCSPSSIVVRPMVSRTRQPRDVPRVAATKIGAPDACKGFLLGDTAKGEHGYGTHPSLPLESVPADT